MASNASTLASLARARCRGQRPEIFVVVGREDARTWAMRNRFFFIDERELVPLETDLTPFAGLVVLVRTQRPWLCAAISQRLALHACLVIVFDTVEKHCEYLAA